MTIVTTAGGSSVGVNSSSTSTDNHVVRWDGVTGDMIQDNGVVTISDAGVVLGITSLTVDNIIINGNGIAVLGTNQPLTLDSTGTGTATINGVVVSADQNLSNVGNITLQSSHHVTIPFGNLDMGGGYISLDGIIYIEKEAAAGISISHRSDNGKTIQEYRTTGGIRKGWMGYGSGSNNNWFMFNEHSDGDIQCSPRGGSGNGNIILDGFTQLGGATSAPKIKMKTVTGQTSSSSSGNISIAHGLTGANIIGLQAIVRISTNSGMPQHYEGGSNNYEIAIWFDATYVYVLNSGSSITSKTVDVLITYKG